MGSNAESYEKTVTSFSSDSEKLCNLINEELKKSDLSIPEIVENYFQIMNVNSHITLLKKYLESGHSDNAMNEKIQKIESFISEKFNNNLHPRILSQLTKSIEESTKGLQSSPSQKSKEDIENEAKLYSELREKMSTKEFVEQYDKGLTHD